ncbi:MAG: type III-A CRISPR-associated RAMP protein Csm5 [Candidatus Solibacter usitatus]|nr:type III-A CRISPR-associated RAMP protein Csm5 [Candidatus Solibacter usitatus]
MRYRLTCLTPVLVGDGGRLSAIDYMVWKDHVNVLDQRRIFRLLSKGPRLDGYLSQLKKATKLDFASWGGFAQNFAGRRIPFENPASAAYWDRASAESLAIPTFSSGPSGPYLPGAAIKGALRTGVIFSHLTEGALRDLASRLPKDRPPRRPAEALEDHVIGAGGSSRMRTVAAADSAPVAQAAFKVYLVRTATLTARGKGEYALGWKSQRGSVDGRRPEEGTPGFVEMASPGSAFEGQWQEKAFFDQAEIRRALGWREPSNRAQIFQAANRYAAALLTLHKQYAGWAGLAALATQIEELETRLAAAQASGACLLSIGWGGGLLGKSAWLDTANAEYRQVMQKLSLYDKALASGLPFPKTRRVVFLNNQPATLPGWALLEVS